MQTKQFNGAIYPRSAQSPQPLLATKLHIPQARRDLTPRPRLLEQLNQALSSKLTLISAPAGFGKTTLVSQWIHQMAELDATLRLPPPLSHPIPHPLPHPLPIPVAWFTLDAGDNDPLRFWRYMITACQTFDGHRPSSPGPFAHGAAAGLGDGADPIDQRSGPTQ